MASDERVRKGFLYFRGYAKSQDTFTLKDLIDATGWSENSIKTYRSKQWKDLLEDIDKDLFRVRAEFLRLTEREFLDHITQKRPLFAKYRRTAHPNVLFFEFLIPLTREGELRAALDELFYADTVRQRILEIGLDEMESLLPRESADEQDDDYLQRAVRFANRFFGYSITHVAGRFRAGNDLMSRIDAAKHVSEGGRYLVDETTAVVRFILPLEANARPFADSLFVPGDLDDETEHDSHAADEEARVLREVFFLLFAEAVVRTIKGEDEIWLIESGLRDRVYRWSRDPNGQ